MSQPQSIKTYYEQDHDRLDEQFRHFQENKSMDFAKAKEFFKTFKVGLQRHIVWEEEILFPLFEEKTGMADGGPTQVMRLEHQQIGEHLEAIHEKVRAGDPNSQEEEKKLLSVLSKHNFKEENILYPAIENSLTESEKQGVFTRMENLPEERYRTCCRGH